MWSEGLPVDEMMDSGETVAIALDNGASGDSTLLRMQIERYNSVNRSYITPSWGLTFVKSDNLSQDYRVLSIL